MVRSVIDSLRDYVSPFKTPAYTIPKIASYILSGGILPLLAIIAIGGANLSNWCFKQISADHNQVVSKIYRLTAPALQGDGYVNVDCPNKTTFIHVLNQRKYYLDGTYHAFDQATPLREVLLTDELPKLKEGRQGVTELLVADLTTEEAIAWNNGHQKIALNFANAHHAGGGPSCCLDTDTQEFRFVHPSARAQEESLAKHTDVMVSLTMRPHTVEWRDTMPRSWFKEPLKADKAAYLSENTLFALPATNEGKYTGFDDLQFVEPCPVTFVTSAATHHGDEVTLTKGDAKYLDHKTRITAHFRAALTRAIEIKNSDDDARVEVILGAFGCGAFAPKNGAEYTRWTAEIYQELIGQYPGIFDLVTFAVPTFGRNNPKEPAYINHQAFNEVFASEEA